MDIADVNVINSNGEIIKSTRCIFKKNKKRCELKTTNPSGFCHVHLVEDWVITDNIDPSETLNRNT